MIQTKQELIALLPHIYQNLKIPVFLLSDSLSIIASSDHFFKLEQHYFQTIIDKDMIHQYPVHIIFHEKEIYFSFYYPIEDISYICLGPVFSKKITSNDSPSEYDILKHVISHYTLQDLPHLPYATHDTSQKIIFIYQMITGKEIDIKTLKLSYQDEYLPSLKEKQTVDEEMFYIRESLTHEFSYSYEQKILDYIKNENSSQARILMNELLQIKDDRQLSKDQIQSSKYKLVCAVAVFTRGVIDAGVPVSQAYTLSDVYIMKIDRTFQPRELRHMISSIIIDFTALVKRYKHIQNPYWVKKCKDYISHNLHHHILLEDIAQNVGMNSHYLSTQFKKITGESLKQYINRKKIEEAQFLIKNSDYTLAEITDILQFSNQSHFNSVFKSITGLTPTQFKNNDMKLKY